MLTHLHKVAFLVLKTARLGRHIKPSVWGLVSVKSKATPQDCSTHDNVLAEGLWPDKKKDCYWVNRNLKENFCLLEE